MTLEEYAAKHPVKEPTDIEKKISELESQLWATDLRNDPTWVIRQAREHNRPILEMLKKLRTEAWDNEQNGRP